jgi:hypothetical protein
VHAKFGGREGGAAGVIKRSVYLSCGVELRSMRLSSNWLRVYSNVNSYILRNYRIYTEVRKGAFFHHCFCDLESHFEALESVLIIFFLVYASKKYDQTDSCALKGQNAYLGSQKQWCIYIIIWLSIYALSVHFPTSPKPVGLKWNNFYTFEGRPWKLLQLTSSSGLRAWSANFNAFNSMSSCDLLGRS